MQAVKNIFLEYGITKTINLRQLGKKLMKLYKNEIRLMFFTFIKPWILSYE